MKKFQGLEFLLPILLAACLGPSTNLPSPESSVGKPLQVTVYKPRL